ncbi:hypothetical protein CL1_1420 [Thermococcus cleftensis]|uniref:Uncharacterized protein n=1 Tax=Thermococcus cleftensis (strain DSM 27260 / KACC 17922 / CL1) TaxID=163003 RepID=I3ZV85_THECF|nr:hypothetical protein [Thermococcus cleftensis]AFL95619.1 hypothetical protein CL1_1420 [Thermococcus cleftensis]
MGKDEVLKEIDRRIKRLEAEIQMAEERLKYLEEIGAPSKYRALQRKDYTIYYLVFMGVWMLAGTLALILIRGRVPYFNVPLLPYLLISIVILAAPLLYLLLSRGEKTGTPMEELEERERLAREVLALFYRPLREAVEKDDRGKIKAIAEELLNNPVLANAVEKMAEGEPKLMAYALYLYASYSPELEDEVRGTLERLGNRPLRALLSELVES